MDIYNYRSITKEFTGSSQARIDPLESKAQEKDVFLIPANATDILPPDTKVNEIQVFNPETNIWEIYKDYRGTIYYSVNGEEIKIEEIGVEVPLGVALKPPPVEYLEPFWDGELWKEAASEIQLNEVKIQDETLLLNRTAAIQSLIGKGELSIDFV